MATTTKGMDVAEVTRIGRQLQNEASNIGDIVSRVRSQIAIAERNWQGTDATHFISDWQAKQSQLANLQSQLNAIGQKAQAEARQQSAASGG